MPPPSGKFEITNYDVLADEISNPITPDERDVGLSLAAHSYHVGNNRLEVLCNIHNQAYSDYQAKGDESKSAEIVEKIMNIVQNQCVPKGRFLERSTKGEWKEVETIKARKLVRQALSNVQNQTSGSSSSGQSALDLKKKQEADAEKKRRRRSSLLRRSVSSSMLPTLMAAGEKFDDKKKSTRVGGTSPLPSPANSRPGSRAASPVPPERREKPKHRPAFGRSRSVELIAGGGRQPRRMGTIKAPSITEADKMDVLFNTSKTALLPGTDLHGNNRLRVMVSIQTSGYMESKEQEQTRMAEELVKTIENFWGGRVLSKVPSLRGKNDGDEYVKLDKENAVQAMKNLLSGKALAKEDAITAGDDEAPETNKKQGRRASLQAIQSIAATGISGKGSASILPSTLPTLPAEMQHLRSAAVKSLQKRKQRQGLNNRIRGLTADKAAVFQDGSSNASVMSGQSGSTSPIPTKIVSNMPSNIPTTLNPGLNYRQTSSGASVASTASNMSTHPNYNVPPPGTVQRQGSISAMSTGSSVTHNTQMSMNTMNAARTMASINLNGPPRQIPVVMQQPNMMQQTSGMGGPVLGSELHIPSNSMMPQQLQQQNLMSQQQNLLSRQQNLISQQMPQQMPQQNLMQQQMPLQMNPQLALQMQQAQQMQFQQQAQFQQRVQVMMPAVPEEPHYGGPPPLSADQLAQLNQGLGPDLSGGQFDPNNMPVRDRNSLLNSTGSDGLPKFQQGEMELLIKGLEMAENQQQH